MNERKTEKTGEIAVVDEHGNRYTVVEYTGYLNAGTLEKPIDWIEGMRSYALANGDHCNLLEDGSFEVVRTGLILSKA